MKNKKNIYMVNLPSSHEVLIPYTCSMITSQAKKDRFIQDNFNFMPYIFQYCEGGVNAIIKKIENPYLVGISLYNWNLRRSHKLALNLKSKYPNVIIVGGGPSVPEKPDSYFDDKSFDFFIRGEGEIPFRKLLLYLLSKIKIEDVSGLVYFDKIIKINKKASSKMFKDNFDYSPYLSGDLEYYIELLKKRNEPIIGSWETTRGCPYSCSFCNWGSYTNSKIRQRDLEILKQEVIYLARNLDTLHICDANFGVLPRDLSLAKKLSEASPTKITNIQVSYAKNSKERVLKIADIFNRKKWSRFGATLSMQSLNKESLFYIDRQNIKSEKFIELQTRANDSEISSYVELILGLPGETLDSFLESIEFLLQSGISDLRVYRLSMLENTKVNSDEFRKKFKIKTQYWPISFGSEPDEVELSEVVKSTSTLSENEINKAQELVSIISILHFGKWTWFISKYFFKEHNINYISFYTNIVKNKEKINCIMSILDGYFLKTLNGSNYQVFSGKKGLFNIDWTDKNFKKETFIWLCVNENKYRFYHELCLFLLNFKNDSRLEDLMKFQKDIMLTSTLDSSSYKYDWLSYFNLNKRLVQKSNRLIFDEKTVPVGNNLYDLAGGDFFLKNGNFIKNLNKIKLEYI